MLHGYWQLYYSYYNWSYTEDFYKDIANHVERWFDTSNFNENDKIPPPIGMNKNVIGLFKFEVGGKTMELFVGLYVGKHGHT